MTILKLPLVNELKKELVEDREVSLPIRARRRETQIKKMKKYKRA